MNVTNRSKPAGMNRGEFPPTVAFLERAQTEWGAHAPRVRPTAPRGRDHARHRAWSSRDGALGVVDADVNRHTRGACAPHDNT